MCGGCRVRCREPGRCRSTGRFHAISAAWISAVITDKDADATLDTPLFGEGLGLDSLETAELSATLEDEVGTDPFSAGLMPETLGEILDFYEDAVSS